MEGIHMLRDLLRKGDFMVKIDLKDAYFTVQVWQGHQKFLRFYWKESLFEFACLPFGLASAPRVFTKLMKPVVALLRQMGIRLVVSKPCQLPRINNPRSSGKFRLYGKLSEVSCDSIHKMEFLGFLVDSRPHH
jgi:hypothetical protein